VQSPLLLQAALLIALVVRGVEDLATGLPPELTPVSGTSMELILGFVFVAS
jgi:hypothetical protein